MKKLVLFLFSAALVTGAAMAQTAKQEEKKDLREDIRDKRAHKKAVRNDVAHLRFRKAHQQHEGKVEARKDQHATAKDLRAKGVEHPTRDAKKVIHKQHEAAEKKNGK
jgi:hypothetical protein